MDHPYSVVRRMQPVTAMLGLVSLLSVPVSHGQTTSITSSGLNTVVTPSATAPVPTYNITGGTRPGNGPNLFHSFGDFSVGTQDRAVFLNDSGLATTNILGRVTGGHPSNIFGNITTTTFQGANLYLINPAGVLFGPTASFSVSGSVTVSTADYLRLADGLRFNAIQGPQDTLLSQAPVVAFGFLNTHPRPITVQGATLEVIEGKALSLVGGDINLAGASLIAPGGQIDVISVASRGEVRMSAAAAGEAAQPQLSGLQAVGNITMTDGSLLATIPAVHSPSPKPPVASGPIVIRGGQLVMDHATISSSQPDPRFGAGQGGPITITVSDRIRADHSSITASIQENQGGAISLVAGKEIRLTDSRVQSIARGFEGTGGPVALTAPLIRLDGSSVEARGNGFGGSVTIQAEQLYLQNGSQIDARGGSIGGSVVINAGDSVRLDKSGIDVSLFSGNNVQSLGNISITVGKTMSIQNQGFLAANSTGGNAGNIVIEAGKSVAIQGHGSVSAESFEDVFPTGGTTRSGNGGNIIVQAPEQIRVVSSSVSTSAHGDTNSGSGGNINLSSNIVRLRDQAAVESMAVDGPGGTITIKANDFRKLNSTVDVTSQFGQNGTVILP